METTSGQNPMVTLTSNVRNGQIPAKGRKWEAMRKESGSKVSASVSQVHKFS